MYVSVYVCMFVNITDTWAYHLFCMHHVHASMLSHDTYQSSCVVVCVLVRIFNNDLIVLTVVPIRFSNGNMVFYIFSAVKAYFPILKNIL